MAFIFERIKEGDAVQSTPEYRRAVEFHYGLPCYTRMVDIERDMSFYCISVNSNAERPPGKYVLFFKNNFIVIDAYEDYRRISAECVAKTFRVVSIQLISDDSGKKAEDFRQLVKEALEARGLHGEVSSPQAIVDFVNC